MNKKAISKKKILYLVSEDFYFCSHRLSLAKAALKEGYEVVVATRVQHHQKDIEKTGIRVIPLSSFDRSRLNPLKEVLSLYEIIKIYRQENPFIAHNVALKLVLYGGIAALCTRTPRIIHTLGGLGYLFISKHFKTRFLRFLVLCFLKLLLRQKKSTLILQNKDDYSLFLAQGISQERLTLIPGSGVNIDQFKASEEPPVSSKGPILIFLSRMLKDKGVYELIEAARLLKERSLSFQLFFYGCCDSSNPTSLSEDELRSWEREGLIQWKGLTSRVAKVYHNSHIAVLPSYREGLPKSLLEAAASGRPIVTTDVPGCREVIINHETGLLVPLQDSFELAKALELLMKSSEMRKKMGQKGRTLTEQRFSEQVILKKTLFLYNS